MKAVRFAVPLAALAIFACADARAQEAKTHVVDARGLKLQVPTDWKQAKATSSMRAAELKVDPAEGDDYPAELVVFVFPGGAGGVDANVDRWRKMFKDENGAAPKAETSKIASKAGEVARVETSGHYHPAQFPGRAAEPDRDGARLLGAILVSDGSGYFIRMIGPDETMRKLAPRFDEMLKALDFAK